MRFNVLATSLVGAGLLAGGAVQAAQITQTITVPTQTTDLNAVPFTSSIGLFNMRLGTLQDVRLTLSDTLSTSGNLTNTASQTQTFQFDLRVTGFTSAGAVVGSGAAAQSAVLSRYGQFQANTQTTDFGTATYTLASGASGAYPVPASNGTMTGSSAVTLTDAATLAAFTGAGSFDLAANTTTGQTFNGGGGNIATNLTTTSSETFTVVYDYAPPSTPSVPEPASMALLAAGLFGVGMVRRRRA